MQEYIVQKHLKKPSTFAELKAVRNAIAYFQKRVKNNPGKGFEAYIDIPQWYDFGDSPIEDEQGTFDLRRPTSQTIGRYKGFNLGRWVLTNIEDFDLAGVLAKHGRTSQDWNDLLDKVVMRGRCADYVTVLESVLQAGWLTTDDLEGGEYGLPLLPTNFVSDSGHIFVEWREYSTPILNHIVSLGHGTIPENLYAELLQSCENQSIPVCKSFRIVALTYNERGARIGYRIEFFRGEETSTFDLFESELNAEGTTLWQSLASRGFHVESDRRARDTFKELIRCWEIGDRSVTVYSRPGWHHQDQLFIAPNGDVVVDAEFHVTGRNYDLADGIRIGGGAGRVIVVDPSSDPRPHSLKLQTWRERVARPVWQHETPQFAFGLTVGCAGAIASLIGEHVGFYYYGRTSTGKSVAQRLGASCVGAVQPDLGVLVNAAISQEEQLPALRKANGSCLHVEDTQTGKANIERLVYQTESAADGVVTPITISS
jgi:hypothetical protein